MGVWMRRPPWFLLLVLPVLLAACGRRASAPGGPSPGKAGGKITIAMMPKLRGIDYFTACQKGAEEAARELGDIDLIYDGPTEAKVDKQVEMIDTWVTQRVNAIAVAANDPVAIAPALKKAREAGITVITYDADAGTQPSGGLPSPGDMAAAQAVRQFFVNQC